nr:PAS domain S-box protein [Anaerolineae bacterium]
MNSGAILPTRPRLLLLAPTDALAAPLNALVDVQVADQVPLPAGDTGWTAVVYDMALPGCTLAQAFQAAGAAPVLALADHLTVNAAVDFMRQGVRAVIPKNDVPRLLALLQQELDSAHGQPPADFLRQNLQDVLETTQEALLSLTLPERRLAFASAAFEKVIGYPLQPFLDDPSFFKHIVHPDDLAAVQAAMQTCMREGTAGLDHRVILPDGAVRWLRRRAWIIYDAHGQPIRVNDSARDITAERRAEEALRESEEIHRLVLSSISDAVFVTDDAGNFTFVCPNVHVLFGYDHDQVLALGNIHHLLSGDLFDRDELRLTGEIANLEQHIRDQSGQWHQVLMTVKHIHIGRGTTLYTFHDITERRQMQEELRQREDWMALALQASDLGKWHHTIQTGLVRLDDRAREHYGFAAEVVSIDQVVSRVHPDDRARLAQEMAVTMNPAGRGRFSTEYRVLDAAGHLRWLAVEALVYFEAGQPAIGFGTSQDITRRKETEQSLRTSEARYRSVVEDQTELVCRYDHNLRLTFANSAYCKSFGIAPEAIMGRDILEKVPPEDHARSLAHVRSLTCANPIATSIHRSIQPDGTLHWTEWKDRAICDEQGQIVEYQGIGRDITAQKLAQDALRASEEKYRSLIESSDAAISMLDADGHYLYVNAIAAQPFGTPPEQLIGQPVQALFPPQQAETILADVRRVIREGRGLTLETEVLLAGQPAWCRTSVQPVRDAAGRPCAALIHASDITDKKQAEQDLLVQNAILYQSRDLIAQATLTGEITFMNQAGAALMGSADPAELVGRSIADFHAPAEAAAILEHYLPHALAHGYWRGENRLRTLAGRLMDVDQTIFPIRDSSGTIIRVATIMVDIRERKAAEIALRQSEAHLRSLMDSQTAFHLRVDLAGDITYCNARYAQQFGWLAPSLIGLNALAMVLPVDHDRVRAAMQECLEHMGRPVQVEVRKPTSTGGYLWTYWEFIAIMDGDRPTIQCVGFDISRQKSAEEALRRSQQQLSLFIDYAPAAIAMLDRQMCYVAVSRRWMQDYNLDKTMIGQSHYDIFPEIPERWRALHRRGLAGEILKQEMDMFLRADGTVEWLRWEIRPWYEDDGLIGGILIFSERINDRIKAEEALRASERRYRQMFELIGLPKLIIDPDSGLILDANPAALEFYGHTLPDLKSMTIAQIGQAPLPELLAQIGQVVRGELTSMVLEHRLADGTGRVMESYIGLIDLEGRQACYCTCIDVTERNRARAALQEAYELLEQRVQERTAELERTKDRIEAIFNHSGDGILLLDMAQGVQQANHAFNDMFAVAPESYFGAPFTRFFHPDDSASLHSSLQQVAAAHQIQHLDARARREDGHEFDVEISIAPVNRSSRPVTSLVCIIRDVTERRLVEEALEKYSTELHDLYNNAPNGYHSVDATGTILRMNDTELRWLGYGREEVLEGLTFRNLLSPASISLFEQHFPVFKERGWTNNLELEIQRKDGSTFPVLLNATAVYDEQGRFLHSRSTMS